MNDINFDANSVQPDEGFAPIPNGEYLAQIVENEIKQTKNGAGAQMVNRWEIIDGPNKGRKFFDRITVQHSNADAQRIGQGQLSALCRAAGVMKLTSSAQLRNRPVRIMVVVTPERNGYGPGNEVKGYKTAAGQAITGAPAPAPTTTTQAPPWATPNAA